MAHGHEHPHPHTHPTAQRVVLAFVLTFLAAAVEVAASRGSGSLFLAADAVHLLAHGVIFGILLVRPGGVREDVATIVVLLVVIGIGIWILWDSVSALTRPPSAPPNPLFILVALAGLAANVGSALLFRAPAAHRTPFRVALAHELADGALTLAAFVGALAIGLWGLRWVDPGLSLAVGAWLLAWSARLLVRRARFGQEAWAHEHP